jgi:hypothetical protein
VLEYFYMSIEYNRYERRLPTAATLLLAGGLLVGACSGGSGDAQAEQTRPAGEIVEIPGCDNWQIDFAKDAGQGDIRTAEIITGEEGTMFDRVSISMRSNTPEALYVDIGGLKDGAPGTPENPPEGILDVATPVINVHAPNADLTLSYSQEADSYPVLGVTNCSPQTGVAGPSI